jgi:hypothetical protein
MARDAAVQYFIKTDVTVLTESQHDQWDNGTDPLASGTLPDQDCHTTVPLLSHICRSVPLCSCFSVLC